ERARERHRCHLRRRGPRQREARRRRLLGDLVRPLQDGRPGPRGDRRRARRQADRRQARHRPEPRHRAGLPGHVDPDAARLPGRQAGQADRRRPAEVGAARRPLGRHQL
ncbi:MAG: Thioredoxin, partial [uncultured Actinomycetospora sp.]